MSAETEFQLRLERRLDEEIAAKTREAFAGKGKPRQHDDYLFRHGYIRALEEVRNALCREVAESLFGPPRKQGQ